MQIAIIENNIVSNILEAQCLQNIHLLPSQKAIPITNPFIQIGDIYTGDMFLTTAMVEQQLMFMKQQTTTLFHGLNQLQCQIKKLEQLIAIKEEG